MCKGLPLEKKAHLEWVVLQRNLEKNEVGRNLLLSDLLSL